MTMSHLDKSRIARNFSSAADRYDASAFAQAKIAEELADALPPRLSPSLVVDLGCGTGRLTGLLMERYPKASIVGLDLAPGMISACQQHCAGSAALRFVAGDAEDPAMLVPEANLIACSCSAQWFQQPATTIKLWAESLAPEGLLAGAFLIEGSFIELDRAYRDAFNTGFPGLRLWHTSAGPAMFSAAGLNLESDSLGSIAVPYASAREALRSFHDIGATLGGQPSRDRLSPSQMRLLLETYDRQGPVNVTYRVQYLIGQKTCS